MPFRETSDEKPEQSYKLNLGVFLQAGWFLEQIDVGFTAGPTQWQSRVKTRGLISARQPLDIMQTSMQMRTAGVPFVAGRACRKTSLGNVASFAPASSGRVGRSALIVRAEKPQVWIYALLANTSRGLFL